MKKRIVCAMLAAMMVFSTATPTLAAIDGTDEAGTVESEGEVKSPIYKVSVSTDLNLYIDPFQLLGNSADITSSDFAVINKSNADIEVKAAITMDAADGVKLVKKSEEVKEDDTSKLAFIQVQVPSKVTTKEENAAAYISATDWTTPYTTLYKADNTTKTGAFYTTSDTTSAASNQTSITSGMIDTTKVTGDYTTKMAVNVDPTTNTVLSFALQKATYVDVYEKYNDAEPIDTVFEKIADTTNSAGSKGAAVFRFGGKVNTKADWQDSDIKTKISYSFLALTSTNLATAESKITANSDAHRYVGAEVETVAAFATGSKIGEITFTDGVGNQKISKILKVEMTNADGTYDGYNACEWDSSVWGAATLSTGKITLDSKFVACFNANQTTEAKITYTTVGGETVTATVNVKTK